MVNQTTIKLVELIKDFKIQIHKNLYIVTFIVMKNNVLDCTYSMLLSLPWLCNACVIHVWGNNWNHHLIRTKILNVVIFDAKIILRIS